MTLSSNALVRKSYHAAVRFVKRDEDRALTQREYLDVTFGLNPQTGKPYNERTLRKWLTGERRADRPVARARAGGGTITQTVILPGDQVRSVGIAIPQGRNRLNLFAPKGREDRARVVRETLREQIAAPVVPVPPGAPPVVTEKYRRITSVRGMKMGKARAPLHPQKIEILTRRRRVAPPKGPYYDGRTGRMVYP